MRSISEPPHSFHREHTILCLRSGRCVLCEKPFAVNAAEAEEMISVAREEKRTLMEAMWMRFMPSVTEVRRIVSGGAIGDILRVTADFGFRADFDPENRLFDRSLGGGALLDVGIYPLSLAHMLMGEPESIDGTAVIGDTGVDGESTVTLGYAGGRQAVIRMSIRKDTPCEALISGTKGYIRIQLPWWRSERIILNRDGRGETSIDLPIRGNGYICEAEEFMDLIRTGRPESEIMPLAESLAVMKSADGIRRCWGLEYPMERPS